MTEPKYGSKNRVVAILLAVFFGTFGVHRFYLGDIKKGVLYLVFCWTMIPFFVGLYDAIKYVTNEEAFGGSDSSQTGTTVRDRDEGSDQPSASGGGSAQTSAPDDAIMAVEGVNGVVTLYDNRLEISREDIGMLHKMQHGFKGDKEIPYESITSMQLRKPSTVTRGYIQFGQSGFSESDDGLMDATSDENTVLFEKGSLSDFEELRAKVRELKQGDVEESTGSIDDAMEKLRERYASGEIDEEEYSKRKEILEQD